MNLLGLNFLHRSIFTNMRDHHHRQVQNIRYFTDKKDDSFAYDGDHWEWGFYKKVKL